jgi:RNA polymerase sigma-70 factor, ECF subfamily
LKEPRPDEELITGALQGDERAFVTLCERHRSRMWRVVQSVARGADAEDLAQEVVIRAFRALRTFRREAAFEAWYCRIALNVAHDHQRSAWKRRVLLFDLVPEGRSAPGDCPEGKVQLRELQRRVRQEVAGLPEAQRVPIWLHYFEEFSLTHIARLEGVPESTLRSRIRAGLRRLSLSLEDVLSAEAIHPAREPRPAADAASPLLPERNGCGA